MTEQELRAMVREAIARQASASASAGTVAAAGSVAGSLQASGALLFRSHASHDLLHVPSGDGPCLIEPAVMCNHCGYCKSYGH
jgi:hypothetical protein